MLPPQCVRCHSLSSSLPFGLMTVNWMRGLVEPSSNAAFANAWEDISVSFTWAWQEGMARGVGQEEWGRRAGQVGETNSLTAIAPSILAIKRYKHPNRNTLDHTILVCYTLLPMLLCLSPQPLLPTFKILSPGRRRPSFAMLPSGNTRSITTQFWPRLVP